MSAPFDLDNLRNKIVMVDALIHADDCESKEKHTHRCDLAGEVLGLFDVLAAEVRALRTFSASQEEALSLMERGKL